MPNHCSYDHCDSPGLGFQITAPNNANAADCQSRVYVERVLPVRLSQIPANCAGEVDFLSAECFVLFVLGEFLVPH